jgi:2-polyprenyl-6-hydroxyphenyl methylase/3-demethylubiquinone-9 3-methyltransferase
MNTDFARVLTTDVLDRSTYTSHWQEMRTEPGALAHKQRRCQYVAERLGGVQGKRVVDFGCGTGLLACYLGTQGAREVLGIEVVSEHLEFAEYLKEAFGTPQVHFSSQLDVEEASIDAVILADVITHIYRPFEHLARIRDALKPGGVLFVVDHNNMTSPMVRRVLRKEWAQADNGFRSRRLGGDSTYGMTAAQAEFWADRSDRPSLRGYATLDPVREIYEENAFYPRDLAHALVNVGFAIREVGPKYVFDFKTNRLVSHAFRLLPGLAIHVAPSFEIVAVKV